MPEFATHDLYAALRKRFEPEAFALMFEVANATGARHSRWADAVTVGLWPSRGLSIGGYELKASRTDWLKELKEPAKADAIGSYCHHWWLVVTDPKIVRDGELPITWGMLALTAKETLRVVKPAPLLKPQAISHEFLAALMRSACKPHVAATQKELQQASWKGRQEAMEQSKREVDRAKMAHEELLRRIAEFEAASGIAIGDKWRGRDPKRTGQLVREVLDGKHDRDLNDVKRIRDIAATLVAKIDESGVLKEAC